MLTNTMGGITTEPALQFFNTMPHAAVTPEIETVLRAARVEGNKLILTGQRLTSKLYVAVNKVLVNAGGKWSRSEQAHIFDAGSDPMTVLGLSAGEVVRDAKKDNQSFYTPPELARRIVQMASVEGKYVLEPSCGNGALIMACLNAGAEEVSGFDIDAQAVSVACSAARRAQAHRTIITCLDFLTLNAPKVGTWDRVVANFPFAKNADVKHCAHAWKFLKPGGRLVAIMWPNTSRPKFQQLINGPEVSGSMIIPVEKGAFAESGTDTASIIVVLDKKSS